MPRQRDLRRRSRRGSRRAGSRCRRRRRRRRRRQLGQLAQVLVGEREVGPGDRQPAGVPADRDHDGVSAELAAVGNHHGVRVDEHRRAGRRRRDRSHGGAARRRIDADRARSRRPGWALARAAAMSIWGRSPRRPSRSHDLASRIRRAARASVRTGAGPEFRLVPPTLAASMSVTSAPSSRACRAALAPAGPPPSTSSLMATLAARTRSRP